MESGSRRLDLVEFVEVSLALGVDPAEVLGPVTDALARYGGRRE